MHSTRDCYSQHLVLSVSTCRPKSRQRIHIYQEFPSATKHLSSCKICGSHNGAAEGSSLQDVTRDHCTGSTRRLGGSQCLHLQGEAVWRHIPLTPEPSAIRPHHTLPSWLPSIFITDEQILGENGVRIFSNEGNASKRC